MRSESVADERNTRHHYHLPSARLAPDRPSTFHPRLPPATRLALCHALPALALDAEDRRRHQRRDSRADVLWASPRKVRATFICGNCGRCTCGDRSMDKTQRRHAPQPRWRKARRTAFSYLCSMFWSLFFFFWRLLLLLTPLHAGHHAPRCSTRRPTPPHSATAVGVGSFCSEAPGHNWRSRRHDRGERQAGGEGPERGEVEAEAEGADGEVRA